MTKAKEANKNKFSIIYKYYEDLKEVVLKSRVIIDHLNEIDNSEKKKMSKEGKVIRRNTYAIIELTQNLLSK